MTSRFRHLTPFLLALPLALGGCDWAVLDTRGPIAESQRDLIFFSAGLVSLVGVPVLVLTVVFAWRYRAGNERATYRPDWHQNHLLEVVWWTVPVVIIAVLSVVTWRSSHALDPYRPLDDARKPLVVEVIALNWKWLFIYPEERIAAVNLVQFPVDRPVTFKLTGESPMNSFWIPQLAGQIYTMEGMQTKLHLRADRAGDYAGLSANFSGEGFNGMRFTARASSAGEYEAWVAATRAAPERLDMDRYRLLVRPSAAEPVRLFGSVEDGLFMSVMMRLMPMTGAHDACPPPPAP